MAKLYGAQKMVLQAIQNAQGETSNYIDDSKLTQATQIAMSDMRNWLLTLDQEEYIDLTLTNNGLSASITPKGRLTLGLFRPLPSTPAPEPSKSRSRTGREKALVIGISDYPSPIRKLPAVANDVREMARLLGSDQGQFPAQNVRSLADGEATSESRPGGDRARLSPSVQADDAVFAYMAGHGEVVGGEYYFIAHDTTCPGHRHPTASRSRGSRRPSTPRPASGRSCGSTSAIAGGSSPVTSTAEPDDREVISRALEVVQGQGKLIIAACTPGQKAYESAAVGHGLFTDALLQGAEGRGGQQGRGDDQLALRLHRQGRWAATVSDR